MHIPSLQPPGECTGHSNPSCYLGGTGNCSEGLSREHYVSEGILRRFTKLRISGMPWQKSGDKIFLPSKALAAKILCERHNNALAPIDDAGARAFDELIKSADYALRQKHEGRIRYALLSGHGLELWTYKLMAGVYFGGIASANGSKLRDTVGVLHDELTQTLTEGKLSHQGGLFITQNIGQVSRDEIAVAPLLSADGKMQVGVGLKFGPLTFETVLIDPQLKGAHLERMRTRKRPHAIDFSGPARDARVLLTWPNTTGAFNRIGLTIVPD